MTNATNFTKPSIVSTSFGFKPSGNKLLLQDGVAYLLLQNGSDRILLNESESYATGFTKQSINATGYTKA